MDWMNVLKDLAVDIIDLRGRHGSRATEEVERTDLGKRQTRFEKAVYELAKERAGQHNFDLEVEASKPVVLTGTKYKLYVDPVDGTAGDCRTMDSGVVTSDPATIIAVMPVGEDLKFGDCLAAAVINLRSNQAFVSNGAEVHVLARCWQKYERPMPALNYKHAILIASEVYRRINRTALGILLPIPVEFSDLHSSGMNILQAPLGKADIFVNNPLPEASDEGQRGHELAAMMPFVRALGSCAIDMRTREDLAETAFTFDDMTPCLIAVDEATARYFLEMIDENSNALVKLETIKGQVEFTKADLIKQLLVQTPTTRYSFRPFAFEKEPEVAAVS